MMLRGDGVHWGTRGTIYSNYFDVHWGTRALTALSGEVSSFPAMIVELSWIQIVDLGKLSRTILLDFFRLRPKTTIYIYNCHDHHDHAVQPLPVWIPSETAILKGYMIRKQRVSKDNNFGQSPFRNLQMAITTWKS